MTVSKWSGGLAASRRPPSALIALARSIVQMHTPPVQDIDLAGRALMETVTSYAPTAWHRRRTGGLTSLFYFVAAELLEAAGNYRLSLTAAQLSVLYYAKAAADAASMSQGGSAIEGMTSDKIRSPSAQSLLLDSYGLPGGINLLVNRLSASRAMQGGSQLLQSAAEPSSMRSMGTPTVACKGALGLVAHAARVGETASSELSRLALACAGLPAASVPFNASSPGPTAFAGIPVDAVPGPGRSHSRLTSSISHASSERIPRKREFTVVSMCDYDSRKTSLTRVSLSNKARYCQLHGYDCQLHTARLAAKRPHAWSKIALVRDYMVRGAPERGRIRIHDGSRLLRATGAHRSSQEHWVVWLDCDSIITNSSITLDHVVNSASQGPWGVNTPSVVISEDGAMVNTGMFAMRAGDPTALTLLDVIWSAEGSSFDDHDWWE